MSHCFTSSPCTGVQHGVNRCASFAREFTVRGGDKKGKKHGPLPTYLRRSRELVRRRPRGTPGTVAYFAGYPSGTAASLSSESSKYSILRKPNQPATTLPGNCMMRLF